MLFDTDSAMKNEAWRKGWDSNPRWVSPRSISSRVPLTGLSHPSNRSILCVLFQHTQLSSPEFAKAKHGSSVSVMRWTATDVQIWVRDELACAREFDLASPGWLLRNRRTSYGCFGEGGSWVGRDASGGKKCYNFRLATPSLRAAYCMSQGQPTLLLVVHQDSQVVCAAVHKYSHLIQNFNPP